MPKRYEGEHTHTLTCRGCHKPFTAKVWTQRYCSEDCRWKGAAVRFWKWANKTTENECWIWSGPTHDPKVPAHDYGKITVGKPVTAHRFSYWLHHGPIPEGMDVLHSCDNPKCTNPRHLRLGNQTDNNKDRDSRGRGVIPKGEKHGMSKLNAEKVVEIRSRFANGESPYKIASEYSISVEHFYKVAKKLAWAHV